MRKLCLVINPIAGMGGSVGLKGTDGILDEAVKRGAHTRSPERARIALERLKEAYTRHRLTEELEWYTASGPMGEDLLTSLAVPSWKVEVVHTVKGPTTAKDTSDTVRKALEKGCELIVFCGGDGTARNVLASAGNSPIFGIPSGVKMHSGVFAVDPSIAGELIEFYVRGEMSLGRGEVIDLDEDRYRQGDWNIRLYGTAWTLYEPTAVQGGKSMVAFEEVEDTLSQIAEDIAERTMEDPKALFILGPGGTLMAVGEHMKIDKTLLGVDIVSGGKLVAKDVDERTVLTFLSDLPPSGKAYAVLSPIGGQGFLLGRGNLQFGPDVVRRIGFDNLIAVSPPQKLEGISALRVDTGDHELDLSLRSHGHIKVLIGYRTYRLARIG